MKPVPAVPAERRPSGAGALAWAGRPYPALALAALASGMLAVALGGVVRATGSGLGCPDWPLCHGRPIPPLDLGAWLEYLHRLSVAGLTVFSVLAFLSGVARHGRSRPVLLPVVAVLLLGAQIALGALTVLLELAPAVALIHMAVATAFVGTLALMSATEEPLRGALAGEAPASRRYLGAVTLLGLLGFLLVVSGAGVTRTGAALACLGYPLCGEPLGYLQTIHMLHRLAALLVLVAVGWAVAEGWRQGARVRALALVTVGLFALQVALGAVNVLLRLPVWAQAGHVAAAVAFFAAVMVWVGSAWTPGAGERWQEA